MLVSQVSGGLYERFFEEIGEGAQDKSKPPGPEGPTRRREDRVDGGYIRHRDTAASWSVSRKRDGTEKRVQCLGQERSQPWTKNNSVKNGHGNVSRPSRDSTYTRPPSCWSTSPCSP